MKRIVRLIFVFIYSMIFGSCIYVVYDDDKDCRNCEDDRNLPEGAVDLGLSVAWATTNLGAEDWLELGDYYAWGDTTIRGEYSKSSYSVRYNKDIASAKMGGEWRMPTVDEVNELVDKCDVNSVSIEGVDGVEIVARNGNRIFIPASGYIQVSDTMSKEIPMFWIYATCESYNAYTVAFKNNEEKVDVSIKDKERYLGIPVRAVWACHK